MYDKIRDNLTRLMKHKNHPNILLYNVNDNKLMIQVLHNIYNITKDIIIQKKNISYIQNNIYYEFNMKYIKYKNKFEWLEILKDLIMTKDYYSNKKKIIILNNYSYLNFSIQNILKVIIEKNHHITFILICEKITNILEAIKSRFIMIRIPNNLYYKKYKLLKDIKIDEYIKHKNQSIEYIEQLKITNNLNENMLINNFIEWIFLQFNMNEYNIIKKIKEISYLIISINISHTIFIIKLLEHLLQNSKIINKKKYKIIYFMSDFDYKYIKSYYNMIHMEYLLLGVYTIIKT